MNKIFAAMFILFGLIKHLFFQDFEGAIIMMLLSIYFAILSNMDEIAKKVGK